MKYAKPVIKDKFWIVKDDSINIATVEKRKEEYVVIVENQKHVYQSQNQINEYFKENIFDNTPKKEQTPVKQNFDIDGYSAKVKPHNIQWFDTIPTYTKTSTSSDRYCAGFYGVRFEGGVFFSNNPKLSTITEKCIDFIGPYKTEMEANINISTKKKQVKQGA